MPGDKCVMFVTGFCFYIVSRIQSIYQQSNGSVPRYLRLLGMHICDVSKQACIQIEAFFIPCVPVSRRRCSQHQRRQILIAGVYIAFQSYWGIQGE